MALPTSDQLSAGIGLAGTAVSDLFSSKGNAINAEYDRKAAGFSRKAADFDRTASGQYIKAAGLARENEVYAEENTSLKQMQADRTIFQTLGGQVKDVAAAGLKSSGSALDLLADSTRQGELTKSAISTQGIIDKNAFEQQAQAYEAQSTNALASATAHEGVATAQEGAAEAADTASEAGGIGAIINGVASVAKIAGPMLLL